MLKEPWERESYTEELADQNRALGITAFTNSSEKAFEPKTGMEHFFFPIPEEFIEV